MSGETNRGGKESKRQAKSKGFQSFSPVLKIGGPCDGLRRTGQGKDWSAPANVTAGPSERHSDEGGLSLEPIKRDLSAQYTESVSTLRRFF